jgi:hypothetical protein
VVVSLHATTTTTTLHEDDWEPKLIFISIYTCHQLASPVGEQMCEYNPEFIREATAKDISVKVVIFFSTMLTFLLPAGGLYLKSVFKSFGISLSSGR